MKKLIGISLFMFWAFFTAILAVGLVFYQNKTQLANNNVLNAKINNGTGGGKIILNSNEIAKHGSINDCWMVINSKIYDVTKYLPQHPGGPETMISYCGKEATQAFETKERSQEAHSSYANDLLALYYVGDLNQITSIAQNNTDTNMNDLTQNQAASQPQIQLSAPAPNPAPTSQINLDPAEIAKHNSTKDCWVIMNGKVYNITNYLPYHPGGAGTISPYCGKDGAAAFNGLPHSSYASSLLSSYYVGGLNQNISASQIQQNIQDTANTVPPPKNKRWDDDDDEYDD